MQTHDFSRGTQRRCDVVRLTPQGRNSPIFKGFGNQIDIFHWHGDVFDLPEGAIPLAVSEYSGSVEAYSIDGKIAMLFHLEMTPKMIDGLFEADRDWFRKRQGFIEYHCNIEGEVKSRAEDLNSRMEQNARKVFDNFLTVVERRE